jgi:hypothetical protein
VEQYKAAYNHCHYPGIPDPPNPPHAPPLSSYLHGITYTIKNVGTQDSPPFKVGKWRLPTYAQNPNYNGSPMTLVLDQGLTEEYYLSQLNVKLLGATQVGVLKPGETFTDSFIPYSFENPLQFSDGHYWFAVFPDIYGEVIEPHENNSFKAIKLTMDKGCGFPGSSDSQGPSGPWGVLDNLVGKFK